MPTALVFSGGPKVRTFERVTPEDMIAVSALQNGCEALPKGELASEAFYRWGLVDNSPPRVIGQISSDPKSREISYRACLDDLSTAAKILGRVSNAEVLLVGLGGLGTHVAEHLARIGTRRFHLVDPDVVEESNLNRQLAYSHSDIGAEKTEVCAGRLRKLGAMEIAQYRDLGEALSQVSEFITDAFVTADSEPHAIRKHVINSLYPTRASYAFAGYSGTVLTLSPMVARPSNGCGACLEFLLEPGSILRQIAWDGAVAPSSYAINAIGGAIMVEQWMRGLAVGGSARSIRFDTRDFSFSERTVPRLSLCPVCGEGMSSN